MNVTEIGVDPLHEAMALSGSAVSALRSALTADANAGLQRALLTLMVSEGYSDAVLREQLIRAYDDAKPGREQSLVRGIFIHTHRHYRQAADHVAEHLERYPADPAAVLLMSAFELAGDVGYRRRGYQLTERQYALAGSESWPWASWLAAARAEQARIDEAMALAEHALELYPRSGSAAHARAHALHELGAGPDAVAWLDEWMAPDPGLVQRRHLNWHAALQALVAGDLAEARRRADTELAGTDVGMRSQVNWRLLLIGAAPANTVTAEHARTLLAQPGGMVDVFHTFQLALALAVAGDHDALSGLATTAAADERPDYAEVLAPVATALAAILTGRPATAVDVLSALGARIERLGGVRVEREIVQDTLARALIDAGEPDRAAELLHHRVHTRAHPHYEHQLLASG